MNEDKYWLWLTMVFGVASRRIWEAMCVFENAEEAYMSLVYSPEKLYLTDSEVSNIKKTDIHSVELLIKEYANNGINILSYGSEDYPKQLRHIYNPPAILYYKGDITCLKRSKTVTAVGTRAISEYGIFVTTKICRELAESGLIVISGFAKGTDITAHLAAANKGYPTVCVLGCGVDVNYPKDNFSHRETIINSGGLFITEYPPGTPPNGYNFPKRNRILAALGYATIVFEASNKSGSLITAGLASEQGRDIFSLPPANIFNKLYSGNIELIRDGAIPLMSSQDVIDCFDVGGVITKEIEAEINNELIRPGVEYYISDGKNPIQDEQYKTRKKRQKNIVAEATSKESRKKEKEIPNDLTLVQRQIVEALGDSCMHADAISQKLGVDSFSLMTEMTELEINGIVKSLPGKMFKLL